MARLGDVIEQIRGVSYKPSDLHDNLSDDSVILLRANNIQNGKIVFDDVLYVSKSKVSESQYLRQGDILVCTSSGSKDLVGKAAFVDEDLPVVFGAFCKVVRPKIECCKYMGHFFQSPYYRNHISVASAGANINNLRNEHIADLQIPLPPMEEQKKIAAMLDKVSDLIAKRRRQLDKLDLLVKARFLEMFGECKTNPFNWDICNLEDIAQIGSSKRVFVDQLKQSGIPFYRGTEVGALAEGKIIKPDLFITEEHYQELCLASGKPKIGDLLMPSICPDGRIWVVNSEKPFYFKDGRVLWVHDISKDFNSIFLLYTLKNRIITDYTSIASGTTFAELKIFSLKKCKVFSVPIELQNKFADFVEQTEKTKTSISRSLETLETLKKSLMQEYFG